MTRRTIILATWGTLGDLYPFLRLGGALLARGHRVIVCTPPLHRDRVLASALEYAPLRPALPTGKPEQARLAIRVFGSTGGIRHLWRDVLAAAAEDSYADVLDLIERERADCVVSHTTVPAAATAAEVAGIVHVTAVLQPMSFLTPRDPPAIPEAPWLAAFLRRRPVSAWVYWQIARSVTRRWVAPFDRLRRSLGLPDRGHPMFEGQHSSAAILALFSRRLMPATARLPAAATFAGFLNSPLPEAGPSDSIRRFLDEGPPPLLFTPGFSVAPLAGDLVAIARETGRLVGRRVLFAGDVEGVGQESDAQMLVAPYVPFAYALPRCAAVVCHGGIGTLAQAVGAGKPVVCIPYGIDQPDNARRFAELGVARIVPRSRATAARISRELEHVLELPRISEAVGIVSAQFAAEAGDAVAPRIVEDAIDRHAVSASACQSPASKAQ